MRETLSIFVLATLAGCASREMPSAPLLDPKQPPAVQPTSRVLAPDFDPLSLRAPASEPAPSAMPSSQEHHHHAE